ILNRLSRNLQLNHPKGNNYTISSIKSDIQKGAILDKKLTSEEQTKLIELIKQDRKPTIKKLHEGQPKFAVYFEAVKKILTKKIRPSEPIRELLENALLQEWVRDGIKYHSGQRDFCGFCGNPIDQGLWKKLGAHFTTESEELRKEINQKISELKTFQENIQSFLKLDKDAFYAHLTSKFNEYLYQWQTLSTQYISNIDTLIGKLRIREQDIFSPTEIEEIPDVSISLMNLVQQINLLIEENNIADSSLREKQSQAKEKLRLSEIAKLLEDIDYQKIETEIQSLQQECATTEKKYRDKCIEVEQLLTQKKKLEEQQHDESKGADLVNKYLSHYFGHGELRLVADAQNSVVRFQVKRRKGGIEEIAHNLSEGERSLIAFCYFIAKINDELQAAATTNDLIIYIDDPISSLDANHIFFMFSLIEDVIAKPKLYRQLFISTHNLDFLKYLKRLTKPKKEEVEYWIIQRKSEEFSTLSLSPQYFRDYTTEFNYLFHQINLCAQNSFNPEHYYSFGNNLRKFLEAYLFYKYPNHKIGDSKRLEMFFGSDTQSLALINRLMNEYSHLKEQFDRSANLVDVAEMQTIAQRVIDQIKTKDDEQYQALMDSIQ
ncbi:MAG: AAA family ATPase, partial [Candidatus Kapaibacteriota bacterium]